MVFVQTFVRVGEQTYSNLIGIHVDVDSFLIDQRLEYYAKNRRRPLQRRPGSFRSRDCSAGARRAESSLLLAYIDGLVLGFAVIGALLLMLLLHDPPTHLELPAARR